MSLGSPPLTSATENEVTFVHLDPPVLSKEQASKASGISEDVNGSYPNFSWAPKKRTSVHYY